MIVGRHQASEMSYALHKSQRPHRHCTQGRTEQEDRDRVGQKNLGILAFDLFPHVLPKGEGSLSQTERKKCCKMNISSNKCI